MSNVKFVCYPDADAPSSGFDLDVSGDTDIAVTFSVQDLADVTKRKGAFSKTIALPSTKGNDAAFRHAYNVQSFVGGFTPNKQVKCAVWSDGVQVFAGTMQLLSMSVTKGQATYEVAIYGEEVALFSNMADVKLVDTVGVTGMNHTFSVSLVTGTWDDSYSDASGYVYGIVDAAGHFHCYDVSNPLGPLAPIFSSVTPIFDRLIPIELMRPNIWVKKMVDLIFAQHGYRYQSAFFDTTEFERMVIPYAGDAFAYASGSNKCYVGSEEVTWDAAEEKTIIFDQTGDPFFNGDDGKFNTTNGIFTASSQYAGKYQFRFEGLFTGASGTTTLVISARDSSGNLLKDIYGDDITYTQAIGAFSRGLSLDRTLILRPSQTLKVTVSSDTAGLTLSASTVQISLLETFSRVGQSIDMRTALPADTLQIDLLADLQKMFNLYFYQSPQDPSLIYIEPWTTFYSSGSVDWSQKSDENAEMTMICGDPELRKRFTFAYRDGGEALSKQYRNTWQTGYGSRQYDTDNFYGRGEQVIETKAATVIPAQYRTNIVMGRTWDVEADGSIRTMKTGYRLAQYNYVKMQPSPSGSVETWLWVDAFKTTVSSWVSGDTLPYIGHVDNPYNPSQDLAFGMPRQLYFALPDGQAGFTPYTNNNLFNTYWRNYIEEIASKEAMQVEATFLLTVTDIATLDFRIPIYWHGIRWRLLEIKDYRIGQNVMCRVTLRRILNLAEFSAQSVNPVGNYNLNAEVQGEYYPQIVNPIKGK
jgi:hypothetical protein